MYFGLTDKCRTDIQSNIIKGIVKITAIPIKVNMDDTEIDKLLLGKELSEWMQRTRKLLANTGQAYIVIIGHIMTFTRSKVETLKFWEEMPDNLDLIALVKGIKGLIFKHDDAEYFYIRTRSALRGFLKLHQGGATMTEYHKR